MTTSELTGVFLDYWVAKAEGYEPWAGATMPKGEFMWKSQRASGPAASWLSHRFSQDWAFTGPIIERERINLSCVWDVSNLRGPGTRWLARHPRVDGEGVIGDTPLIAAMRAYVASKFGDEVPDGKDIRNG